MILQWAVYFSIICAIVSGVWAGNTAFIQTYGNPQRWLYVLGVTGTGVVCGAVVGLLIPAVALAALAVGLPTAAITLGVYGAAKFKGDSAS